MDRLKKARTPTRATFTRVANEIKAELGKENPDNAVLEVKIKQLEGVYDKLQILDDQIKEAMLDADDLEQTFQLEEESVQKYSEEWLTLSIPVNKRITKLQRPHSPAGSESSHSTTYENRKRNFKLPKIELKKFNGEYEEYLGWWAQFSKIHEDKTLHEADKFHYLVQAMVPDTRSFKLVKSYPATVENYPKVIEALQDKFGDKTLLAEVYIRRLQSIVLGLERSKSKFDLCKVYDDLETQLRCLESLKIVLDHSVFMLPLIESTLPVDLLKVWQRRAEAGYLEDEKKTTDERLKSLLKFLKREVKGEERIKIIHGSQKEEKIQGTNKSKKQSDVPTAQSLFSGSTKCCIFCAKVNHVSQDCLKATHMSLEELNQKVKDSHSCYRCLKRGHISKNCKSAVKCSSCGRRHYGILCRDKEPKSTERNSQEISEATKVISTNPTVANASACHASNEGVVFMKTVQVDILDQKGQKHRVRLLFDEGSNRSYIKTATAESLKCPVVEEFNLQTTLFGGQTTVRKPKRKYTVYLQSTNNKFKKEFQFINEDVICGNCPVVRSGPWMQELSKRKIFVNDIGTCSPEIEILIGSNFWPNLMTGKMCKLDNGLIAVESVFGWTLSGEIFIKPGEYSNFSSTVISMLTQGEKSLPDMWELETIGITDPVEKLTQKEHDEVVKTEFKRKISRDSEGRYVIQLPWIDRSIPLPNYKNVCEKSLVSLTNKLRKESLLDVYDKIFKEWEHEGIIEVVNGNSKPEHYLSHHRVLKPDSKTTPVRPVFNASFKTGNNPSLNDCLQRGPNLLELITTILLRFRNKDIGVISDIRKAFQMISVHDDDKNFQKFLWWEEDDDLKKFGDDSSQSNTQKKMKVHRHCRVVFGMNCSPFILAAVLEHHFDHVQASWKYTAEVLRVTLCGQFIDFL